MKHNNVLSIAVMTVYIILMYIAAQAVMPSDYPKEVERGIDTVRKDMVKLE